MTSSCNGTVDGMSLLNSKPFGIDVPRGISDFPAALSAARVGSAADFLFTWPPSSKSRVNGVMDVADALMGSPR